MNTVPPCRQRAGQRSSGEPPETTNRPTRRDSLGGMRAGGGGPWSCLLVLNMIGLIRQDLKNF